MKAVRFSEDETAGGGVVFLIVGFVCAVADDNNDDCVVFVGPGPEDYFRLKMSADDAMTQLGFNNGGEG